MKKSVLAFFACLVSTMPVFAQNWLVDMEASSLTFTADQGGAEFTGTFGKFDAAITFDPEDPSKTDIRIDIDIASISTGDATRDGSLPGGEWFAISEFPTAHFEATSARMGDDNKYILEGPLTLKGITVNVELPFSLKISDNIADVSGTIDILRTDFKIGEGDFASEQVAGHGVIVNIHLVAKKAE